MDATLVYWAMKHVISLCLGWVPRRLVGIRRPALYWALFTTVVFLPDLDIVSQSTAGAITVVFLYIVFPAAFCRVRGPLACATTPGTTSACCEALWMPARRARRLRTRGSWRTNTATAGPRAVRSGERECGFGLRGGRGACCLGRLFVAAPGRA